MMGLNFKLTKQVTWIVLECLLLMSLNVNSAELVCNNEAKKGTWEQGIGNGDDVNDINKEFQDEFQGVVKFMDSLPVKTDQDVIEKELGKKPISNTSFMNFSNVVWEIDGTNSSLQIFVAFFNGCIAKIILGETLNGNFRYFHRKNMLARH